MTAPAIEVTELSYAYGEKEAVRQLSFSVAPGEILGFLGPNGAGKSTTIKMLTAQLRPKSGTAKVLGHDVTKEPEAIHARIGVCFEEKNLYLNMSATENLSFFASLFGLEKVDVRALLDKVGLADKAEDRVVTFSKGMRQRLMMARALVNTPDVLFLDEPTDGLDPASSQAVRDLIQSEADRGAAILLTTHDMHEADQLSNRVAFLNEGRLHALDTPENLKLAHGLRAVKVKRRVNGKVVEETLPLDDAQSGERLKQAMASDGLMTIHTEEASLEAIFVQMTGRGLE